VSFSVLTTLRVENYISQDLGRFLLMGESKRRKEFNEKNLIVLPGGLSHKPVRRYRTIMLEIPLELFELVEKLQEVSVQMTEDAPRSNEEWWQLIIGKGAEVVDLHIQGLVRAALERERDKPSIERMEEVLAPGNEKLLTEIKEILSEHSGDRSGGPDRSGEGYVRFLSGGDEEVPDRPVLGGTETGSPDATSQDPQGHSGPERDRQPEP
jgi:hypothetical protein